MEYFNGRSNVDVSDISCLDNMTQEMANAIATGPQDAFFTLLDRFNSDLTHYINDKIDVTDKWNWRPGTYDKIDKMILHRLALNKKAKGVADRIIRTKDRANYLSYIYRQANELEIVKREMKQSGLSKDVNIEEFQGKANKMVEIINTQCKLVKDLTEGKVIITPFMSTNFQNRRTPVYFDIKLNDLNISIYSGSKSIQEIPLETIHIIFAYPFRHLINKINTQWIMCGNYGNTTDGNLRHPYISQQYRNGAEYGTVCLDRYTDDISKAFRNLDFVQMSMHLMNWAQYYSTGHSNPYNNTQWLHYGVPGSYSKEYASTISNVSENCSVRIRANVNSDNFMERQAQNISTCNEIKCQLRDTCNHYRRYNDRLMNITEKTELHCQVEAIIGWISEWSYDYSGNFAERANYLGDYMMYISSHHDDEEEFNYEFIRLAIQTIYNYNRNLNDRTITVYYNVICKYFDYFPKEVIEPKELSEDEVKESILAWATSPERR